MQSQLYPKLLKCDMLGSLLVSLRFKNGVLCVILVYGWVRERWSLLSSGTDIVFCYLIPSVHFLVHSCSVKECMYCKVFVF